MAPKPNPAAQAHPRQPPLQPVDRSRHGALSTPNLTRLLDDALVSYPTAELAVLHLIHRYQFDLNVLFSKLDGTLPYDTPHEHLC